MKRTHGFTIVELLIVIVVIGILAAIGIVAYSGVQQRAVVASLQSDLTSTATQLKLNQVDNSVYPTTLANANGGNGVKSSTGTTYQYSVNSGTPPPSFCLTAVNGSQSQSINQDSILTSGGKNLFQQSATFVTYTTGTDTASPAATYTADPIAGDYQNFSSVALGANRYWYPITTDPRVQGTTYTISLEMKTTDSGWRAYWYPSENYATISFPDTGGQWQRWSWTYTQTGATNTGNKLFGFRNNLTSNPISFRKLKLEAGNAPSCWVSEP
jgi:general secretion pathway protein G